MVLPLLSNYEENVEKVFIQPNLRDLRKIRLEFKNMMMNGLKVECKGF